MGPSVGSAADRVEYGRFHVGVGGRLRQAWSGSGLPRTEIGAGNVDRVVGGGGARLLRWAATPVRTTTPFRTSISGTKGRIRGSLAHASARPWRMSPSGRVAGGSDRSVPSSGASVMRRPDASRPSGEATRASDSARARSAALRTLPVRCANPWLTATWTSDRSIHGSSPRIRSICRTSARGRSAGGARFRRGRSRTSANSGQRGERSSSTMRRARHRILYRVPVSRIIPSRVRAAIRTLSSGPPGRGRAPRRPRAPASHRSRAVTAPQP